MPQPVVLATPRGDARVTTYPAAIDSPGACAAASFPARTTLLLSHGAGGGIGATDLVAMAAGLPPHGAHVLLVEQPWRVAGRRLAPAPAALDEAFVAVVEQLGPRPPFVVGGRSAGARVACRTAATLGAAGVLALAFPLCPPGRPDRSRADELAGTGVATLVVQGDRDPFGGPDALPAAPHITAHAVPGADHGFAVRVRDGGPQAQAAGLACAVDQTAAWLRRVVGGPVVGNT